MTDTKRIRPALGLSMAAAMIALSACGGGGDDDTSSSAKSAEEPTSQESSDGADEATEPDLEGIPDVVAEVNGEEVTKDEFVVVYEAQFQAALAGGEQPDEDALKEQTADSLVSTELLAQEAEARGIAVTDQALEDELATLAEENQFGSVEELFAALEEQGATEDQARAQLESQMLIEQLAVDEAGSIEPTEQDLRTIYAEAKEQAGKGQKLPAYAKVRSQIVDQAKSDRISEVAQTLVDELRKDADIVNNL